MIDVYFWPTPNGRKVSIMFEETGLSYTLKPLDITRGEQFEPDFLALNPNNKIPVIVDAHGPGGEPLVLFESGAILEYLAHKSGLLMPKNERGQWIAKQWLMFQMGNIGPMWGQQGHFIIYAPEPVPYAIERYTKETRRLYGVMDKRLAEREHLAGDDYSIADIATFPWAARHAWQGVDLAEFPNVKRWYDTLWDRPAVRQGYGVP